MKNPDIEQTNELLKKYGYNENDLEKERKKIIDNLEKSKKVIQKSSYTDKKITSNVIDFVYVIQHNMPWKTIILKKIDTCSINELKFYYHSLNHTALENKGKLQMQYKNRPLVIPNDDYYKLIEKAKSKGMI